MNIKEFTQPAPLNQLFSMSVLSNNGLKVVLKHFRLNTIYNILTGFFWIVISVLFCWMNNDLSLVWKIVWDIVFGILIACEVYLIFDSIKVLIHNDYNILAVRRWRMMHQINIFLWYFTLQFLIILCMLGFGIASLVMKQNIIESGFIVGFCLCYLVLFILVMINRIWFYKLDKKDEYWINISVEQYLKRIIDTETDLTLLD